MAYRTVFQTTYTSGGTPTGVGDTFTFDSTAMLSDGFGQTYTNTYLNAGSANDDPATNDNFFERDEDLFVNGGTIGATGEPFRIVEPERFDTFRVDVAFYAPDHPDADGSELIYHEITMIHLQVENQNDPSDVQDLFIPWGGTDAQSTDTYPRWYDLFYQYPTVSGEVTDRIDHLIVIRLTEFLMTKTRQSWIHLVLLHVLQKAR